MTDTNGTWKGYDVARTPFRRLLHALLPARLRRAAFVLGYYVKAKWVVARGTLADRFRPEAASGLPLPPARLRYRVTRCVDAKGFLESASVDGRALFDAIRAGGRDPALFTRILDHGCGCGRVARWFLTETPGATFTGTDIDSEAISWCQRNLPGGRFVVNQPQPPLPFPDSSFDLVYSISVFTHIDETSQDLWLAELRRVVSKEAIVLITIHSANKWRDLTSAELATLRERGFLFKVSITGALKPDGLPDFYQTSYHLKDYFLARCRQHFQPLAYVERGLGGSQDIVVLEAR